MSNYKDLLLKIDTMSLDEIKKVENEIAPAYEKMLKEKKEVVKTPKVSKYTYPFTLHFAGRNIETDHIFENGIEYSAEVVRTKMLEHQYYEFAGKVDFEFLKDENVLLPIFQQHKKG